jgi:biopolymer transport protein ExbD
MKLIKIGNTDIVLSHITHFEFSALQRFEHSGAETPQTECRVVSTEKPAHLTIYIDGEHALNFDDEQANVEEAYNKLKEIFS